MNRKVSRKNKGFSLVELIIVVAIMAILAGVMIPQFVKYIDSSKKSGDIEQAQNIYSALASAYADGVATGTMPTGLDFNTEKPVNVAVMQALHMGSVAPTSRVNGQSFTYEVNTTTGEVTVSIGAVGSSVPIAPTVAAGSAWD